MADQTVVFTGMVRPPSAADCTNAARIAITSTDQAMGKGGSPLAAIRIIWAKVST